MIAAAKGEQDRVSELVSQIVKISGSDTISTSAIGNIYYTLGDLDKFFEYMNRAMDIHALPLGFLVNSPLYAKSRKDPRMKVLLSRVNLKIQLPPS